MNRRLFLQLPLAATALAATAQNVSPGKPAKRPKKGIKVAANKDRYQEELLIMGGRFDCKVSSKDTNGDLLIYDTTRQEKGGPALHLHHAQDEWFYVIPKDMEKTLKELFATHGMEIVGPPLAVV